MIRTFAVRTLVFALLIVVCSGWNVAKTCTKMNAALEPKKSTRQTSMLNTRAVAAILGANLAFFGMHTTPDNFKSGSFMHNVLPSAAHADSTGKVIDYFDFCKLATTIGKFHNY